MGGSERTETDLELDASQTSVVALERLEAFPGCDIPHHHFPITAGADDLVALESNSIHWTLMSLKSSEEPKCLSIPDTNESIFRTADDVFVVDTEIEDASTVSGEDGRDLGPRPVGE